MLRSNEFTSKHNDNTNQYSSLRNITPDSSPVQRTETEYSLRAKFMGNNSLNRDLQSQYASIMHLARHIIARKYERNDQRGITKERGDAKLFRTSPLVFRNLRVAVIKGLTVVYHL